MGLVELLAQPQLVAVAAQALAEQPAGAGLRRVGAWCIARIFQIRCDSPGAGSHCDMALRSQSSCSSSFAAWPLLQHAALDASVFESSTITSTSGRV